MVKTSEDSKTPIHKEQRQVIYIDQYGVGQSL